MHAWAALVALALGFSTAAQAQRPGSYPAGPIRLVVGVPPGGNVDTLARVLVKQLETQLPHPIVIDNRGGVSGILGYDIVAKARPDGYTLLSTAFPLAVNPSLYKSLPYDTARDFAPITNYVHGAGYLLAVHPSVPARTVKELITLAKSATTPLRFSSPGIGNGQHLAAELFALKAGISLQHVPYKGGGPAMTALLGNEVQINFPSAAPATPLIHSGKIRALAFTGATRVAAMPDVPTIAEAGLPGFEFDAGWHGWFAPARTPPAILDRIHAEIVKALQAPQVRDFYSKNGYEPVAQKPAEFRRVFLDDIARYAQIVRAAKIEKQ
ncbi:MAG: tripartite tricarboxylate transporter substrate binding protein [Pseudomonadota bacterium]